MALKILSAEVGENADRLTRFRQEARAASALNHPNILTIYEIGESEDGWFIATEYVKGETLRQMIRREGKLPVAEAVKIAEQIAGALAAAHEAHIVHRDIKPENLMIRRDGYIKILDFGLAKPSHPVSAPEDATLQIAKTTPGMVMGSVRYMSPEQARGKDVDGRTDLWSLGIVLFEMLTGKTPFDGETTSDTLASLIYHDVPPISDFVPDAPPELQRIIRKSLRKDREERYQTAKDFALDLRNLRDEIEHTTTSSEARFNSGENVTAIFPLQNNTESQSVHRTSGATHAPFVRNQTGNMSANSGANNTGQSKSRKWQTAFASIGAILVFAAVGFGIYNWFGFDSHKAASAFEETNISRLATDGKLRMPVVSPDGKYVAFIGGEVGNFSLVVRQIAADSSLTVVPASSLLYTAASFTPDGNFIYYVQRDKGGAYGNLFQIPTLGGTPKKIADDVDSAATFAPDGKRLAFVRHDPNKGGDTIFICNADGSDLQPFFSTTETPFAAFTSVVWSPDGKKILAAVTKNEEFKGSFEIVEIDLASKSLKPVSAKKWGYISSLNWFKDGSGFVFTGKEPEEGHSSQVWLMTYPEGELRRITNDLNNYAGVSLSADGNTLVTVKNDVVSSIWNYTPASRELKQITPESRNVDGDSGIRQMPDGRILLTRFNEKEGNIWTLGADGQDAKQLTSGAAFNYNATATKDGRFIVFGSNRTGASRIWRMEADGKNAVQLTSGEDGSNDSLPQVTADNKTVIFQRQAANAGRMIMMRVPLEGGEAVPVFPDSKTYDLSPQLSPDSKRLAFVSLDTATTRKILRIAGFDGEKIMGIEKEFDFGAMNILHWSPDGKSLTYLSHDGIPNLWRMTFDDKPPQPITDFKSGRIFNYTYSQDGKSLFISRGVVNSDLVLIKDAQKNN